MTLNEIFINSIIFINNKIESKTHPGSYWGGGMIPYIFTPMDSEAMSLQNISVIAA